MEIFILVNYTERRILEVNTDFLQIIEELNYYLNKNGHEALIPGLLLQEIKTKEQVEIKAGKQLLAITLKNAVGY